MSQLQVTGEAKIRDLQGPVVSNSGVISALDGDASQYVRGDGTLADFPTSTGGGSSVSYYLNSSVSQGTIGGVAYRQLGKTPIAGAGTDIVISSNGYVASYITDANDPALLEVPAGNFNCEFYFSVNNNTGNPFTYAEVYKYDGTTFTLIGTSVGVPEYINQGTVINPYYFAVPVAQSVLTVTDRIAIRIYVNVDGRTVTLHTENNHLCQVVTTFSKGLISLNNLTRQNQFFGTGTDGTDFNISSITATHTFNLPVASATNTGKLSSTDWSTFNGKVPYTGATGSVDLGVYSLSAGELNIEKNGANTSAINFEQATGTSILGAGYTSIGPIGTDGVTFFFGGATNSLTFKNNLLSASRSYSLPDLSGTLALLEGAQTFTGTKTFNISPISEGGYSFKILPSGTIFQNGYSVLSSVTGSVSITQAISAGNLKVFTFDFSSWATNTSYTYTLPAASGTLALTSNLSAYVPYSGATTSLDLGSNSLSAGISISINGTTNGGYLGFKQFASATNGLSGYTSIYALSTDTLGIQYSQGGGIIKGVYLSSSLISNNTINTYSFPNASGTLALTSNLSAYLPLTGGTLTGNLTIAKADTLNVLTLSSTNNNVISFITSSVQKGEISVNASNFQFNSETTNGYIFKNSAANNILTITDAGVTTLIGALSGTSATFSGNLGANGVMSLGNDGTYGSTYKTLGLTGNTDGTHRIFGGTSDDLYIAAATGRGINFWTNGVTSTRMFISGTGNVGIGTSSPAATLDIRNTSNTQLILGFTGSSVGSYTIGRNATTGFLNFYGNESLYTGYIFGGVDGERMRITSGGDVGIGNTGFADVKLCVSGKDTSGSNYSFIAKDSGGNNNFLVRNDGLSTFRSLAGTGSRAVLADSGGNLSAPISDISVKKNITSIGYGLNEILKMNPVWFDFIDDYKNYGEGRQNGNIAQEMELIIPEAVFVTPSTGKMGINYDQMHAVYIKAIQEQQQQIEELKELIKNK
jgi:hypothetical protein